MALVKTKVTSDKYLLDRIKAKKKPVKLAFQGLLKMIITVGAVLTTNVK